MSTEVLEGMTKPALATINELWSQANEIEDKNRAIITAALAEIEANNVERNRLLNEISVAAVDGMSEKPALVELMSGSGERPKVSKRPAPAPAPAPAKATGKKRGRPRKTETAPVSAPAATGKKRGRPRKNAAPVTATAPATGSGMTLMQAIYDVIDRPPKEWRKLLPELPKEAEGLKPSEAFEIIEIEGKWKPDAKIKDYSNAIATVFTNLKEQGLIAQENRRYYAVAGVKPSWK